MPPNSVEPSSLLIDKERHEILYDGHFYDVTSWIKRHPGGNVIKFYTEPGEDATIPIQQFHNRSIARTLGIMKGLPKRPASAGELGLDLKTLQRHKDITADFHKLEAELKAEGFFKPSLGHILFRFGDVFFLIFAGAYFISSPHLLLKLVGMVMMGLGFGRSGFLMHEGGHNSITGNPRVDRVLRSFVMGVGVGLSGRYWISQHNRHHAMPQRLHHDADLSTLPLVAFNKRVVSKPEDGHGFFVRHQSKLFICIDSLLVALFWKVYLHPRYAIHKRAYMDLLYMIGHYALIYYFDISVLQYLGIIWISSNYMLLNFTLNHSHLPVTSDNNLHWVEYSLYHTTDIEPSWWCDYWMGYLNYQIEHHLFPTMPQFRGREVRPRVEALAKKHNLPFQSMTYWDAIKCTFANLETVSNELQMKSQNN